MAKLTGKNAAISFDGTVYRCLTDINISGALSVSSAECSSETGNANTHKAAGASSYTVTTTALTDNDSIALDTAFALGAVGELIIYQTGNAAGNVSRTFTSAFVSSASDAVAVATQATKALTFECDGEPVAAVIV